MFPTLEWPPHSPGVITSSKNSTQLSQAPLAHEDSLVLKTVVVMGLHIPPEVSLLLSTVTFIVDCYFSHQHLCSSPPPQLLEVGGLFY